jgi:hypothetical protein
MEAAAAANAVGLGSPGGAFEFGRHVFVGTRRRLVAVPGPAIRVDGGSTGRLRSDRSSTEAI